jgi:hypothetical protein
MVDDRFRYRPFEDGLAKRLLDRAAKLQAAEQKASAAHASDDRQSKLNLKPSQGERLSDQMDHHSSIAETPMSATGGKRTLATASSDRPDSIPQVPLRAVKGEGPAADTDRNGEIACDRQNHRHVEEPTGHSCRLLSPGR